MVVHHIILRTVIDASSVSWIPENSHEHVILRLSRQGYESFDPVFSSEIKVDCEVWAFLLNSALQAAVSNPEDKSPSRELKQHEEGKEYIS